MTLLEIATFCSESMGMPDNLTVAQAKKFAKLRWKMIWDFANWRQTRTEATLNLSAGAEVVVLPVDFELVLGVRINGDRALVPSYDMVELQDDAAGMGSPGSTLTFSAMGKDAAGFARIKLHRPLFADAVLLVIGKRRCVELVNNTDTPLLPGVDQALVAFVQGDLYNWQRQGTKAAQAHQEARAHLAKMVELETVQAATIVRFIPQVESNGGEWSE